MRRCCLPYTTADPAATETAKRPQGVKMSQSPAIFITKAKIKYGSRNESPSCPFACTDRHAIWIQKARKNANGTTPDERAKWRKALCGTVSLRAVNCKEIWDSPTPKRVT